MSPSVIHASVAMTEPGFLKQNLDLLGLEVHGYSVAVLTGSEASSSPLSLESFDGSGYDE